MRCFHCNHEFPIRSYKLAGKKFYEEYCQLCNGLIQVRESDFDDELFESLEDHLQEVVDLFNEVYTSQQELAHNIEQIGLKMGSLRKIFYIKNKK